MTTLILFATVEGQTGKIARFVEQQVRDAGHDVRMVQATDDAVPLPLDGVDRAILAASVHERRHPKAFEATLAANRQQLEAIKTLLLSVSLSAAFPEGLEEAQDYLVEMEMRTGLTPSAEALVAGAVRSKSYGYFESEVMRHVVLRGRDYDPAEGEHEFTDWQALERKVAAFLAAE